MSKQNLRNSRIAELLDNKYIPYHLSLMFPKIFEEYKDNIPEWIIQIVDKYDDTRGVKLFNYAIKNLEYKIKNKLRSDEKYKLDIVYNSDIEHTEIVNSDKYNNRIDFYNLLQEFYYKEHKNKSRKINIVDVLKSLYGLDCENLTKSETARKFGVSREFIRQINNRFISYIRNNPERIDVLTHILKNGY